MCGIAGIFSWRRPASLEVAEDMIARLAHRGPDGCGIWHDRNVCLAHARLAIIDPEHGAQPLTDEETGNVLVANGEIYNHRQLRKVLQDKGYHFQTGSDCETILFAWREWGMRMFEHLHGMFAFALYDRHADRLLLARDRIGIKPLFVHLSGDAVYFASETKALLRVLPGAPEVDPQSVGMFLQCNFSSGRASAIHGIESVLPGEVLVVDGTGSSRRARYWSPAPVPLDFRSLDEAVEHFDHLMSEVVDEHLESDVPVALFLSGGLDSSSILAFATRSDSRPDLAMTTAFCDRSVHDESQSARLVAEWLNVRHQVYRIDGTHLSARLPFCIWATDSLMGDYAMLPVSYMAEQVSGSHKVVLSGEGGDEVFAGYGRYRMLVFKRLLRALRTPGTGGFRTRPIFPDRVLRTLLVPPLYEASRNWNLPFRQAWKSGRIFSSTSARMQFVDLVTWLPDDLLVKLDRQLMAWGVEGRVPYLDHRVVEFGLSLPEHFRQRGRKGKVIVREWARKHLPEAVVQAHKKGFTVPLRSILHEPSLDRLGELLPATQAVKTWMRPGAVRDLVYKSRGDAKYRQYLWMILVFVLWHAIMIERSGARPDPEQEIYDFLS
ncbi:MAG: asparagine synthase (glutamine-hydrolyzing) [Gammaproteobacteria bacterium]|nr:MAG: asparagine synthase (glutamine-hydrolyzing) [Gammaproteobacteria bacterium]